jgi:hypothetical protein
MVGIDNLLSHSETHHYFLLNVLKTTPDCYENKVAEPTIIGKTVEILNPARAWTVSPSPRKPLL